MLLICSLDHYLFLNTGMKAPLQQRLYWCIESTWNKCWKSSGQINDDWCQCLSRGPVLPGRNQRGHRGTERYGGALRDGNFQLLNKVEMEKKWEFWERSCHCCTILTGSSSRYWSFWHLRPLFLPVSTRFSHCRLQKHILKHVRKTKEEEEIK